MRTPCAVLFAALVAAPSSGVVSPGTIAFTRYRDAEKECAASIWTVDSTGQNQQPLIDSGKGDCDPAWSPDGGRIAFTSGRSGDWRIWISAADGSNPAQITHGPDDDRDFAAAWSHDGKRLVFQREIRASDDVNPGGWALYTVRADGSQQRRLTRAHEFDGFASWLRDGRILFSEVRHLSGACAFCGQLYIIDPRTLKTVRISDVRYDTYKAAYSPDGRYLAWVRARSYDSRPDLFVRRRGTAHALRVDRSAGYPAWSPDSRWIAYERNGDLFVIRRDGRGQMRITMNAEVDSHPSWRPTAGS